MNPTILGFIGPGFLNQVPTLSSKPRSCGDGACVSSSFV